MTMPIATILERSSLVRSSAPAIWGVDIMMMAAKVMPQRNAASARRHGSSLRFFSDAM